MNKAGLDESISQSPRAYDLYVKQKSQLLDEYLKVAATDKLTINNENRLRTEINELSREREILMSNIDIKIHEQIQNALRAHGLGVNNSFTSILFSRPSSGISEFFWHPK